MKSKFWKNILESFSIFRYSELTKNKASESFKYFVLFFTMIWIISILLSVSGWVAFPDMIKEEIAKVDTFTIDIDFNASENLNFPPKKPLVSIVDKVNESKAKIVVVDGDLIYRPFIGISKNFSLSEYEDIKENSDEVGKLGGALFVLLLPSLIIYNYLFYFIKYILIVILYSLIAKIVVTIFGKKIKYRKLFSAALYSITPLILIEMILLPFYIPLFHIPLILYTIWYIIISIELVEEF